MEQQDDKNLLVSCFKSEIIPFEKLCNYSLLSNPVDAQTGGGNPHAAIGT